MAQRCACYHTALLSLWAAVILSVIMLSESVQTTENMR